jgi:hypothetical protein
MRAVQVVVYSALGVPAAGILLSGVGFVATRVSGHADLNILCGRVLVGSLWAGMLGAVLALGTGLYLAWRRDPSA